MPSNLAAGTGISLPSPQSRFLPYRLVIPSALVPYPPNVPRYLDVAHWMSQSAHEHLVRAVRRVQRQQVRRDIVGRGRVEGTIQRWMRLGEEGVLGE